MRAWIFLAFAIICEVCATSSLKHAATSDSKVFIAVFAVMMGASFALVFQAIKVIELGTAYAVWSGLGLTITALIGFVVFKEQVSVAKVLCLCLIIIGVVGLRYLSAKTA